MHQDYYEGILQLRNPNNEVIKFIKNKIRKKEGIFITKEKKVNNGIDFYLPSQKYLQIIGKKLKKNFCGELKISSKLHTKNRLTSKNVYRVNVLFRLAKCNVGDILNFKGDKIKILKMGKKILAKNIKTGKKLSINYKDL
jgi:NMD protein affecting ribosome stability and mRNA decay